MKVSGICAAELVGHLNCRHLTDLGGTVLQLCLYSDLLSSFQGLLPEFAYVVVP